MSPSCNRTLVERFFVCFAATDVEGLLGLLHPKASCQAMGLSSDPPIADQEDRQKSINLVLSIRPLGRISWYCHQLYKPLK